jgi:hypothetical protein
VNRLMAIFALVVVVSLFASCMFERTKEIRPLTIQVIDSLTKEPIEGAVVYYKLESYREFSPLGLPLPHTFFRVIMMEKTYTDENGVVIFPRSSIRLKAFEHFYIEAVYINLEKVPPPKEDNPGEFFSCRLEERFNPIDHLKGAFIGNHWSPVVREIPGAPDWANFNTTYNWGSFSKTEENILVELERKE